MRQKFKSISLLGAFFALLACQEEKAPKPIAAYEVMTVSTTQRTLEKGYSAAIEGKQDIRIIPQVSGFITDVRISEGDRVKKGQPLFIIDQVPYKAALMTAQANVQAAKAAVATAQLTYDSKKSLFDADVISDVELQTAANGLLTAQAQASQAEAQLTNAKNNLSFSQVKSPADGVVGKIPMRVGTLVGPTITTPLTTVSDNSQMYVYFSWTERQVLEMMRNYASADSAVAQMPAVELELIDGTRYPIKGRIESISGVIDPKTGAVSVRAAFDNPKGLLRSGGAGRVIIPNQMADCITVPKNATFEIQNKRFVFTIADGKAKSMPVEVIRNTAGKDYIVTSGLEAGDKIIVEGVGMLRDGMPVSAKSAN